MVVSGEENGCKGLEKMGSEHREAFSVDGFFASDGP